MFNETDYSQVHRAQVYQRYKSGANWFYWIAGLSLVTSIVTRFQVAAGDF